MMTELETLMLRIYELLGEIAPRVEELGIVRSRIAELKQAQEDEAIIP